MNVELVLEHPLLEDPEEESKIRSFLRQVDSKYYHRKIENRMEEMKKFPLLGEDGSSFFNTYQYVTLVPRKKETDEKETSEPNEKAETKETNEANTNDTEKGNASDESDDENDKNDLEVKK